MEDTAFPVLGPVAKRVGPFVASLLVGCLGVGYALHEHHAATNLAAQNAQVTAQLGATNNELSATSSQLNALTAKVNDLMASEAKPSPAAPAAQGAGNHRTAVHRTSAQDQRLKKIESQLDAQGKEIDVTRNDLASTRTDLASTRTELSGSIARTHGELVVLEKKGERNYFEFDIQKSKDFKHEGPLSLRLRKADAKHGFADLLLVVDDRNLTQKHVNLYQPVMFYEPDSPQPLEVVINDISKDHIHGYVSAPKYSNTELTAMADTNNANNAAAPGNSQGGAQSGAQGTDDGIVGNPQQQPAPRKKLTVPAQDPAQE